MIAAVPADAAPRPVASCWATVVNANTVRITWTSAPNDDADRYAVERSRDGRPFFWKGTVNRGGRSFTNSALAPGQYRYRVITISGANERASRNCGPANALIIGNGAQPPAQDPGTGVRGVVSCWARFNAAGRILVTWTRATGDNAQRFAVLRSRNNGQFFWAGAATAPATQFTNNRPSVGTYRYRVETVSSSGQRQQRDCGPGGGVTVGTPPQPAGTRTIMAIGDSITHGRSDRPSWRYPFQTRARNVNCSIDMVGSENRWVDGPPVGQFVGYDHNHESFGGRTTAQSANIAVPAASRIRPQIALIHTGTNDVLSGTTPQNAGRYLGRLIDGLRSARSDMIIYVAQIIPAGPARAVETARWNAEIRAIVANKNRPGAPVRTVDMFNGWNYSSMTVNSDHIHPNSLGSDFIATRWMTRLRNDGIC